MITGLRLRLPDGVKIAPTEPEEPRTFTKVRWRGEHITYARPVWTVCTGCGLLGQANPKIIGKGKHKVDSCVNCRVTA